MDEINAIHKLKQGEIDGLEDLFLQYHEKALHTAYLITGDLQSAEDAVQISFLNVYRSIRHFDESRPFGPWFTRIVINAAVKVALANQKELHNEENSLALFENILSEEPPPEEDLVTNEFKDKVRIALGQLTPRQRAVVVKRYYYEMSEKEMSAQMGTAQGTVKWLLNVARCRLRVLLGPKGGNFEK
jgi:RNA polymerase sigma-70 factor (ECF subfamily)